MGIIIGIDVGGSTTKIVGFNESRHIIAPLTVKANDPVASSYGAFGKFTTENKIKIADIDRIMLTGVGSEFIKDGLFGIPTEHVTEFTAIGHGGLYLSGLPEAIIVSMGTGTAIVCAKVGNKIEYMGGTGVGGGTLSGIAKKLLGVNHVVNVAELAKGGTLDNIDLKISDITNKDMPELSGQLTAANFGKVSDIATKEDIALGLINMIFESIGMLSIFAARSKKLTDIVLTGNLASIPQAEDVFGFLKKMYNMNFIIPQLMQYSTVIGAALCHFEGK